MGLFAAATLPKGHTFDITGDRIHLTDASVGGPYVMQTSAKFGVDAARRNSGVARWINDPGQAKHQANCVLVLVKRTDTPKQYKPVGRLKRRIASGSEFFR